MPRVPLPDVGVTFIRETWTVSSEDITPRSSLLRTHASIPCGSPLLRLLASVEESSQVATSPCCYRDYPDVISANLSPDAWSPTPTVPPSAFACFFLGVIGLPKTLFRSASRWYPRTRFFRGLIFEVADISLCSGLRVCSPPRSRWDRARARRPGRWRVTVLALAVCETGSQFHQDCVSRGPPIMPDVRISQVRFEALAFRP